MTAAALAGIVVDIVCCARDRPLVGVNLCTAHVADLGLYQIHLSFGARRMLLLGEMLLAEATATIGAAAKGLFAAFIAAAGRSDGAGTPALLHIEGRFVLHICSIPQDRLISAKEGYESTLS